MHICMHRVSRYEQGISTRFSPLIMLIFLKPLFLSCTLLFSHVPLSCFALFNRFLFPSPVPTRLIFRLLQEFFYLLTLSCSPFTQRRQVRSPCSACVTLPSPITAASSRNFFTTFHPTPIFRSLHDQPSSTRDSCQVPHHSQDDVASMQIWGSVVETDSGGWYLMMLWA